MAARVAVAIVAALAASFPAWAEEARTEHSLQAAIDRSNKVDPHSPQTLSARLDYARYLVDGPGDACGKRLDDAQSQLDQVNRGPALELALPMGVARATDMDYRVHLGRAGCSQDAALRERELHSALDAAQRAVALYRDAFDYVSMATMQFNVGLVHRRLREEAAAVAALETAIAMDREWGFETDAAENIRTLLSWKNEPTNAALVSAQMSDFPHRSRTLRLGWAADDARVSIHAEYRSLFDNELTQRRGTRTLQRQIRPLAGGGWVVSYAGAPPEFESGMPIAEPATFETAILYFARTLLVHSTYEINRSGDFKAVEDLGEVSERLMSDASPFNNLNAANSAQAVALRHAGEQGLRTALDLRAVYATLSEDHSLETGMWVDATLEQGVWYDMTADLSLTAAPAEFIKHRLEFAYTRSLPCTAGSGDARCVELVIHATPDAPALKSVLDRVDHHLGSRGRLNVRYWSALYVRLVVDPDSLQLWARETKRYVYLSTGEPGKAPSLAELEQTSATYSR